MRHGIHVALKYYRHGFNSSLRQLESHTEILMQKTAGFRPEYITEMDLNNLQLHIRPGFDSNTRFTHTGTIIIGLHPLRPQELLMSIPHRVHQFLNEQNIPYSTVPHHPSHSSAQSAIAAQVPLQKVVKAVILKDNVDNYVMAMIPAANRVRVHHVNQLTDATLNLATESEVNRKFTDCENGAVPPIGQPYNMEMVWDNRLGRLPDVYLEAGDHETLLHIKQRDFQKIVAGTLHDDLCSTPSRTVKDD